MGSPEVCHLCFIPMWQCWHMLISHMSEDDEISFYPPWADGLVGKGLRQFSEFTQYHKASWHTSNASRISKEGGLVGPWFSKNITKCGFTDIVSYNSFRYRIDSTLDVGTFGCKNCGHKQYFAEKPQGPKIQAIMRQEENPHDKWGLTMSNAQNLTVIICLCFQGGLSRKFNERLKITFKFFT